MIETTAKEDQRVLPYMAGDAALESLAMQIREEHSQAIGSARTAIDHAIKAGHLLMQAKAKMPHGEWLPWLAANCPDISIRTAQAYTRLAKKAPALLEANTQSSAHLSIDRALDLVAEHKPVTEAIARAARVRKEHRVAKLAAAVTEDLPVAKLAAAVIEEHRVFKLAAVTEDRRVLVLEPNSLTADGSPLLRRSPDWSPPDPTEFVTVCLESTRNCVELFADVLCSDFKIPLGTATGWLRRIENIVEILRRSKRRVESITQPEQEKYGTVAAPAESLRLVPLGTEEAGASRNEVSSKGMKPWQKSSPNSRPR